MKWTTLTRQGDCFDTLALEIYGSEKMAYLLVTNNPQYAHYIYLPANLTMVVPQLPKSKSQTGRPVPPWVNGR